MTITLGSGPTHPSPTHPTGPATPRPTGPPPPRAGGPDNPGAPDPIPPRPRTGPDGPVGEPQPNPGPPRPPFRMHRCVKTAAEILRDIEASDIPDDPGETWGFGETARALDVSHVSLREWTRAGLIPFTRDQCRRYRYRAADVLAFQERGWQS